MTTLSADHLKTLEDMRKEFLASPGANPDANGMKLNDSTFLRYLRARSFNFELAKAMLYATIAWREKFGLSQLHDAWGPIIAKENISGKMYVRGFDKEGKTSKD